MGRASAIVLTATGLIIGACMIAFILANASGFGESIVGALTRGVEARIAEAEADRAEAEARIAEAESDRMIAKYQSITEAIKYGIDNVTDKLVTYFLLGLVTFMVTIGGKLLVESYPRGG